MSITDHYQRNANATGHAADCRRRIAPTVVAPRPALDVERCERCRVVRSRFTK